MPIIVNLDMQLVRRKMTLTDLAERVGITIANLSILKQGKARAVSVIFRLTSCMSRFTMMGISTSHR